VHAPLLELPKLDERAAVVTEALEVHDLHALDGGLRAESWSEKARWASSLRRIR